MLTCTILSQNGEGSDPFFGVIYPFNVNAHNGPLSIFQPLPSTRDKMCFPSSVCENFLKNADVDNFISNGEALTRFFGWFILSISSPTMDRGRFSAISFSPWIKCVFPSSASESFLKKMLTCTILSQNGESPHPFFGVVYPFNFNAHNAPGWFSNHFRLSVDKMCFNFFSLWKFSEKMLPCTMLSQNGEGPDPIFLVSYPFHFEAHNELG